MQEVLFTPLTSFRLVTRLASCIQAACLICAAEAEAVVAQLQEQTSADDEYVAEQLQLLGIDPQDGYSADGDAAAESDSDSDPGDVEGRGLEAFEDVLSSWLTAAHTKTSHAVVKAQASLPLRPKIAGQSGGASTLQRIQEQQKQQQQQQEELHKSTSPAAAVAAAQKLRSSPKRVDQRQEAEVLAQPEGKEAAALDRATAAKEAAAAQGHVPSWLADVSSDEEEGDDEEAVKHDSSGVQAPRTASVPDVKPEASGDSLPEAPAPDSPAQHAQHAISSSNSALPPSGPNPATSAPADSPSPKALQASSADHDRSSSISSQGVSSQGVSSQDRKLDPDFSSRARFDPSASWPSPSKGFPAQGFPGQEQGSAQP